MEPVRFRIGEKRALILNARTKSALAIEVDDGHRPDFSSLTYSVAVLIDIQSARIGKRFVRLDIGFRAGEKLPMDGSEHDYLSVGELGFEIFENRIQATFERRHVLVEMPPRQGHHLAVAVDLDILHLIPLPERHIAVEVVGARKNEHGIDLVSLLRLGFLRLLQNSGPLMTVLSVNLGHNTHHLRQISPVILPALMQRGIGDGIAQHQHLLPVPGIADASVAPGGATAHQRHHNQPQRSKTDFFHLNLSFFYCFCMRHRRPLCS